VAPHDHLESLPDELLLHNIADECDDCFTVLFRRYFRQCYSIALRILRDRNEAEDVLQEVFLSIFQQKERFDPSKGSVKTWILQFAHFRALLRRRYLRVRHFYQQEEINEEQEFFRTGTRGLHGLNRSEWAQFVAAGMGALQPRQRRAIELVLLEGYTLQETADLERESLANMRNIYYRGLKSLKVFLDGKLEQTPQEEGVASHGQFRFQT